MAYYYLHAGIQAEKAKDLSGAEKHYQAALAIEPERAEVHARLGALCLIQRRFATNRKKYAEVQDVVTAVQEEAAALCQQLTDAINEDAAAFEAVMAAFRSKDLPEKEKEAQIQQATIGAGEVPLRVARLSYRAGQLAAELAKVGNVNAVTDATAGVLLAQAAVETAALNVKINATNIDNKQLVTEWQEELATLQKDTAELVQQIKAVAQKRGGFA
jgi:glutamate formiminotransferase/formiminotetrahydrofolate cyclodeaminase